MLVFIKVVQGIKKLAGQDVVMLLNTIWALEYPDNRLMDKPLPIRIISVYSFHNIY